MNREEKNLRFNQILFDGLLGRPQDFEYRGQCIDLEKPIGKCTCGHPIRFQYIVHDKVTKEMRILGSECINNYPFLGDIAKQVKEFEERKKAQALAMLEESVQVELQKLLALKPLVVERFKQEKAKNYWVRHKISDVYYKFDSRIKSIAYLKTPKGKIKRIKQAIENIEEILAN